jgi:DNA-binding CsgD family transcriptional regulator
MFGNAVLVTRDTSHESNHTPVRDALRSLVELTAKVNNDEKTYFEAGISGEEILVDAEVDGERYLLLRMPKARRQRIQLSPREYEIVRMVAKGHSNKVIADVLNISTWTVSTHLRRIFAKLRVGSRAAMVAQLLDMGMISNERRLPGNFC